MSINKKVAIALFAATAGVFGLASGASAGEGGAAGSASFSVQNGQVTGAAVAAAVGKNDAAATASNTSGSGIISNTASAMGTAGMMNLISSDGTVILSAPDKTPDTAQQNNLDGIVTPIGTLGGSSFAE